MPPFMTGSGLLVVDGHAVAGTTLAVNPNDSIGYAVPTPYAGGSRTVAFTGIAPESSNVRHVVLDENYRPLVVHRTQ